MDKRRTNSGGGGVGGGTPRMKVVGNIRNKMAPDDVFLLLINPPSKNNPVQKLTAKYVFDFYEKRRSSVL